MMSDAAAARSNFCLYRSMKSIFGRASFLYIFIDSAYPHGSRSMPLAFFGSRSLRRLCVCLTLIGGVLSAGVACAPSLLLSALAKKS
jgi:hypothetical protein